MIWEEIERHSWPLAGGGQITGRVRVRHRDRVVRAWWQREEARALAGTAFETATPAGNQVLTIRAVAHD